MTQNLIGMKKRKDTLTLAYQPNSSLYNINYITPNTNKLAILSNKILKIKHINTATILDPIT